ncbi:MAG: FliH/SctL family protein [Chlamydiales bacterium]
MSVIRNLKIDETMILAPTGELYSTQVKQSFALILEEERRRVFEEGKIKGEQIGYQKALEEGRIWLNLLRVIAEKMLAKKASLLDQIKPEIIEFVINICEQIIRRELSQPENLVNLINSLLMAAGSSAEADCIKIFLAPSDHAMIENHLSQIQYEKIRLVPDPLMVSGDCRIETQMSFVNYNISRELADLKSKILHGKAS